MRFAVFAAAAALCLSPLAVDAATYRIEYRSPTLELVPNQTSDPETQEFFDYWGFVVPTTIPTMSFSFILDTALFSASLSSGSRVSIGGGFDDVCVTVDGSSRCDLPASAVLQSPGGNITGLPSMSIYAVFFDIGDDLEVTDFWIQLAEEAYLEINAFGPLAGTFANITARLAAELTGVPFYQNGVCIMLCSEWGWVTDTPHFRYSSSESGTMSVTPIPQIPLPAAFPLGLTALMLLVGMGARRRCRLVAPRA